jgi:hypothetical protein
MYDPHGKKRIGSTKFTVSPNVKDALGASFRTAGRVLKRDQGLPALLE